MDDDQWIILHRATESGDTLTREIITFIRTGDTYRRADERHVLRLYRPADIVPALETAGFQATALSAYGNFTLPAGWHPFLARKPR